jgi:hypothetical protein
MWKFIVFMTHLTIYLVNSCVARARLLVSIDLLKLTDIIMSFHFISTKWNKMIDAKQALRYLYKQLIFRILISSRVRAPKCLGHLHNIFLALVFFFCSSLILQDKLVLPSIKNKCQRFYTNLIVFFDKSGLF